MKIHSFLFAAGLALAVWPRPMAAHCDTLEGPVVTAARAALTQGDVAPVLMWVKAGDEPAIRAAFDRARSVRGQSPAAAALADQWFFETLVRIHRAGEGAPFTGLISNAHLDPGIEAADHALESGNAEAVVAASIAPLRVALQAKYDRVAALKPHAGHSVTAGREYVAAYVDYIHFAERLAAMARGGAEPVQAAHEH